MYKLLVVDDIRIHLDGMTKLIKQLRPEYEVFESENGKDALDFITDNHVDIVVTDIRMPVMDGLELIEKTAEFKKGIKSIILSSYGEFEYAQKALSVGALDYVLKPVNKKKISDMLNKVEEVIKSEHKQKEKENNLTKKLDDMLPAYVDHLLNKWIHNQISRTESDELKMIFSQQDNGIILLSELGKFDKFIMKYSNEKIQEIKLDLKFQIKKAMNPFGHAISFFLETKTNIMVTVLTTLDSYDKYEEGIIPVLQGFIDKIKNSYGLSLTIGIGKESPKIFHEAGASFNFAEKAMVNRFYQGYEKIYFNKDNISGIPKQNLIGYNVQSELLKSIRGMNEDVSIQILNCMIKKLTEYENLSPQQFIDTVIHVIVNTLDNLEPVIMDTDYNFIVNNVEIQLKNCEEINEFRESAIDVLLRMIQAVDYYKANRKSTVIQECLDYIQENYMEDLTLESLVDRFHFSVSYFSRIFKKDTNVTLNQYILATRIKNAQLLLENTNLKIYKVASKVGYHDAKYFNKVFKDELGMTPDEYRKTVKTRRED